MYCMSILKYNFIKNETEKIQFTLFFSAQNTVEIRCESSAFNVGGHCIYSFATHTTLSSRLL